MFDFKVRVKPKGIYAYLEGADSEHGYTVHFANPDGWVYAPVAICEFIGIEVVKGHAVVYGGY